MGDLRRKLSRLRALSKATTGGDRGDPGGAEASGVQVLSRKAAARHGTVPLAGALALTGAGAATLALDEELLGFDPRTAVYLDTETTGLAGGTGTLVFLVGIGAFEGTDFVVEQLFLSDLGAEGALFERVSERLQTASAVVSFNGKSFDMALLRTRLVMSGVKPLRWLPHLDLLHVCRRVYGARVERCRLSAIEREVLNFVREGDIDGAEIPGMYRRYLREGDPGVLSRVFEHNHYDVAALAALAGELGARVSMRESAGRLEPGDLTGLARTSLRAGRLTLAAKLAREAARRAADPETSREALVIAAEVLRREKNPRGAAASLHEALAHAPEDPAVHLALAKLYERSLGDPERALFHAQRALGAEGDEARAKRARRLQDRMDDGARQLRLPGFV